jgi:hypothetical protein
MNVSAHDVGQENCDREVAGQVSLISVLSEDQDRCQYAPHTALVLLSETLDEPPSGTYAVAAANIHHAFMRIRGRLAVDVVLPSSELNINASDMTRGCNGALSGRVRARRAGKRR